MVTILTTHHGARAQMDSGSSWIRNLLYSGLSAGIFAAVVVIVTAAKLPLRLVWHRYHHTQSHCRAVMDSHV